VENKTVFTQREFITYTKKSTDIDGDLVALFRWLAFESGLPFGQAIIEKRGTPHWSWIHVSLGAPYRDPGKCGQVLCSPDGTSYQRVTRATAL
jgi:hypothetical protein